MKNRLLFLVIIIGLAVLTISQTKRSQPKTNLSQTAPLLVLSNNVCFNAMTHNDHTGGAAKLGEKCIWDPNNPSHITICAENIANMIDLLPELYGVEGLDFVGLQEASKWEALQKAASKTLAKMSPIPTLQDKEYAVTFFDPSKYSIAHTWSDDLGRGRPFQITIFNEGIIFLNIHNGHGSKATFQYITERLSGKLLAKLSRSEIKAIANYRIIAVGDFNQVAIGQTNISFTPFKYAGISTEVRLTNPPMTCCDTNGKMPWSGSMNGDFIFDSKSVAKPEIPSNYNRNELQSDHLPVVAKL